MLSRAGYAVQVATDANDAMRVCATQKFHVVLSPESGAFRGEESDRNA
jgi:PleD family two-component response regulator